MIIDDPPERWFKADGNAMTTHSSISAQGASVH
jgi:hypothetical protein